MHGKQKTDVAIIAKNNQSKLKNINIHAHFHIHYKDHTLHIISCKILHTKYLISCTAIPNNNSLVDFHWGEHYFYHLLKNPNSLKSMIDYEKFRSQLTEEKCIHISDYKTPFIIVSENLTEVFT